MKKILLPICMIALAFASCQKQNATVNNTPNATNSTQSKQTEIAAFPNLTDAQIDSIGIYHNLYMTQAINNFVFNTGNDSIEMRTDLINILESNFSALSNDSLANHFMSFVENPTANLDTLKSSLSNPQALEIIDSCINFVQQSNISYGQILNFLNQEDAIASSDLDGNDRVTVLVFLSILKRSCYLWWPQNMGGSGVGYNFLNALSRLTNQESLQPMAAKSLLVKAAVTALADGEAAASAAEGGSWLLTIPGFAGLYVCAVAASTLVASAETAAAI